jgi:hypothetical protein
MSKRKQSDESDPAFRYGADGFKTKASLPHVLCPRCHDDRRVPPCSYCHGIGAILVLSFGPAPKPQEASFSNGRRLTPGQVRDMRGIGCVLPRYPQEGTKAWKQFEAEFASFMERVREKRKPKLRRGRGEKKLITETPLAAPTNGETSVTSPVKDVATRPVVAPKKRGRPKGSKNKAKPETGSRRGLARQGEPVIRVSEVKKHGD